METGRKIIFFLIFCFRVASLLSCPITIKNDGKKPILVVDPRDMKTIVSIEPGNSGTIDPTLHGLSKYFKNEKLHFFVQAEDGNFFLKYQLIEQ